MQTKDIPAKEPEQPVPEGQKRETIDTGLPEAPFVDTPDAVNSTRAPFYIPSAPPYAWREYPQGSRGPWTPGGPHGTAPRRQSVWPWLIPTLLLVALLLVGGLMLLFSMIGSVVSGVGNSISETQHFMVNSNPTLVLNNDTGSIHVSAVSEGNAVTIQTTKQSGPWNNPNDLKVSYTQDREANTVIVTVTRSNNATFFSMQNVDFAITVPSVATLQLKTNTGNIDVNGVSGQLNLASNTGSIAATNSTAHGNTQLTTNTGSITFNGSLEPKGTYNFATNTGSVDVTLPRNSAFHVDASSDTGSITTGFSQVVVQQRQSIGAEAHGDVGSAPQAVVTLKTNTGGIHLHSR